MIDPLLAKRREAAQSGLMPLLRRLTVRRRIIGGFLAMVFLLALSLPLVVTNYRFLVGRLQQVTNVEARIDRMLLLASARVASSRINLMRYVLDYAPSPYTALDDIDQATQLLEEAYELITSGSAIGTATASPEQKASVEAILAALADYETLIHEIEAARQEAGGQEAVRLEFQAYRFGNDIGQRIELIVKDSEARVAASNEVVFAETRRRLLYLVAAWIGVIILGLVLTLVITRSITGPVSQLHNAAEAFRNAPAGHRDITVPTAGADELSLLARTFNQLSAELSKLYRDLEQRVADRTRELERRSAYLEASAEVGRAATSILETDELIRRMVELIREQFSLYYVGLFLLDGAGEWAVLRAGTGEAGRAMLARDHRIKVGEGMIGWSIANVQPRVALEAGADAVRLATVELPQTRSEAAIPLRSRGQVLGALTVQDTQPGAFDRDTIAVLQTMADQVAVALDNARLFTESQAALEASRRAYGELSYQEWRELTRARPEWGYTYAHQSVTTVEGDWRPEMLQAVRTGRSVQQPPELVEGRTPEPVSSPSLNRSREIEAGDGTEGPTLAIPLRVRDNVVGALSFCKGNMGEAWTTEEIALLETLTEQLSQALESARLHQDTQRRAARERMTGQLTTRIRESLDVEMVLKTAAREIGEALGLAALDVRMGTEASSEEID